MADVSELSRLGHSMLEGMGILSIACPTGMHLQAVKGNWRLDNAIQSKIVAMAFSMATHTKAGVILGGPRGSGKSKLDGHRPEIEARLRNGSTQRFIARRYGTTPINVHRWLNKHELPQLPPEVA